MHGVRCFRRDRAEAQIRRWARLDDGARFGQAVQHKGLTQANLFHARLIIGTAIADRITLHSTLIKGRRTIGLGRFSSLPHRPGEGMQSGDRLRPVHARVGNALAEDQIVFVDHILPPCLDKALQH